MSENAVRYGALSSARLPTSPLSQLIRRRHPLTEACRNRAIVALTSAGHPDMALDMARGMEQDRHYADRATVEFVERCAVACGV